MFSTEMTFKLNRICKNDPNLSLDYAVLKDNSAEFVFTYKNKSSRNKSIGIFPPNSDKSIFLYNEDATKIYKLIDLKKIPKWWPQKKYVLDPNEKIEFTLIFEKIEPTLKVNIIEGKNNFNSTTGWNFLNLEVNSYSFMNKKVIELLDKIELSDKEKSLLEKFKKNNFVNDFISYYQNKNETMKNSFLSKWKDDKKAIYFVDYILKNEYDDIILHPDIDKAFNIISKYPKSNTAKKLKKFIKPILIKQLHTKFLEIKDSNSLDKYALFLNKYAKYETLYSDISDLKAIKQKVRKLFEEKRTELKNSKNPKLYNDFFKKYGIANFKNTIYADYKELEQKMFNDAIIINNPKVFEKFLDDFPNSKYKNKIHEKFLNYFKTNDVTLTDITNYVGKYPDSPYIDEILKLVPKKSVTNTNKSTIRNKQFNTIDEKVEAFKKTIKVGDILHYTEKTSITNPSNNTEETYEIIYSAKVITILKTKIRVKVIDASLNIENPPAYVLSSFQDIRDVMIGNIEDQSITKFKEFKEF